MIFIVLLLLSWPAWLGSRTYGLAPGCDDAGCPPAQEHPTIQDAGPSKNP